MLVFSCVVFLIKASLYYCLIKLFTETTHTHTKTYSTENISSSLSLPYVPGLVQQCDDVRPKNIQTKQRHLKKRFILQVCPRTAKLSIWSVKRFYYVCGLEQMDWCVTGMLFSNCTLQYVKIFHSHWIFFFPPRVCLEHLDLGPDRGIDRMERSWCLMDVKWVLLKSRCGWRIFASVILQ